MPTDGKAVPRIKLPCGREITFHRSYPWDRSAIRGDIHFINLIPLALIYDSSTDRVFDIAAEFRGCTGTQGIDAVQAAATLKILALLGPIRELRTPHPRPFSRKGRREYSDRLLGDLSGNLPSFRFSGCQSDQLFSRGP